jgi:hypothetical protein
VDILNVQYLTKNCFCKFNNFKQLSLKETDYNEIIEDYSVKIFRNITMNRHFTDYVNFLFRDVLKDIPEAKKYILWVSKRKYRFVC